MIDNPGHNQPYPAMQDWKFENGGIELLRERESSHNAGNSGAVEQKRNTPRQSFTLRRLTGVPITRFGDSTAPLAGLVRS